MKRYFTILFILTGIFSTSAQQFSFGVKAGMNMASGGEITGHSHVENGQYKYWTGTSFGKAKPGYHVGAYMEMDFSGFFLRPEIVFTSTKTAFEYPYKTGTYEIQKLDVPILIGYKFAGLVGVYGGPVFSPVYNNSLQYKEATILEKDDGDHWIWGSSLEPPTSPMNFQVGVKTEFHRIGLDLRYEYNLSAKQVERVDMLNSQSGTDVGGVNMATIFDSRVNQFILSITYELHNASDSRRGGSYSRRRRRR